MSAQLIDGRAVAKKCKEKIGQAVEERLKNSQRPPGLAVIMVGDDPASRIYVKHKRNACREVGYYSFSYDLPESTPENDLLSIISQLNEDHRIDGILVQLPLPKHIDSVKVLDHILPDKDVDGFHAYNLGRLAQNIPQLRSCTPYGVMQLLEHYDFDLTGMDAVVIGTSNHVGKPMALELINSGCTVQVCHKLTNNLEDKIRSADLLVVAIGKPGVIKSEWIKPGAIVIDIGITRTPEGKITGDIDFENAKQRASWITPVPGGVGPMTVATLMKNTWDACQFHPQ